MYNRYQGNTGRVLRIEESGTAPSARPAPVEPPPRRERPPALPEAIGRLLPGLSASLETEDILLLLILYLMYRETGDSDLLIVMGGLFLL